MMQMEWLLLLKSFVVQPMDLTPAPSIPIPPRLGASAWLRLDKIIYLHRENIVMIPLIGMGWVGYVWHFFGNHSEQHGTGQFKFSFSNLLESRSEMLRLHLRLDDWWIA